VKVTIKEACPDEDNNIPSTFTLQPRKTIKNYDNQVQGQASGKKNTEEPPAVAINCITFN
jgi:hypothetical protein